jgi:hypothetical protein
METYIQPDSSCVGCHSTATTLSPEVKSDFSFLFLHTQVPPFGRKEMSYLIGPRINFKGAFKTNPCTANNDDVMVALDPVSQQLQLDALGMSDNEAREWLKEPITRLRSPPGGELALYVRAGWNYYGDHSTSFQRAQVTTVSSGSGPVSGDPLIGTSVYILGSREHTAPVIVDLDPIGLTSTQIYLGGFQLGNAQAGLSARSDVRAYSRWLAFNRVVGPYTGEQNFVGLGAVWQFTLPTAALTFQGAVDSSPSLKALQAALQASDVLGLMVRFTSFEVQPYLNTKQLSAQFHTGQAPQNPAFGFLVGTVGLWRRGEPMTEPPGRLLIPNVGPPGGQGLQPLFPEREMAKPLRWCNPANKEEAGNVLLLGNCTAQVDPTRKVVALDLITLFPKAGFRDPEGPAPGTSFPQGFDAPRRQADLGSVELALIPPGGTRDQARTLGPIDYGLEDYSRYEDQGGIAEVSYASSGVSDEDLKNGTLLIRGTADSPLNPGALFVSEVPVRVVSDDRAVYLRSSQEAQLTLHVTERGQPPGRDILLHVQEYHDIIVLQSQSARPNQTIGRASDPPEPSAQQIGTSQGELVGGAATLAPRLSYPRTITVPAGQSSVTLNVRVNRPGPATLVFSTRPEMDLSGIGPWWGQVYFSHLRSYAQDDYAHVTDDQLSWNFVYNEVLRAYYILFPAMSLYFPLNKEDAVQNMAPQILERTEEQGDHFYSTAYMPITRSLSPGKLGLLRRWLQRGSSGAQGNSP